MNLSRSFFLLSVLAPLPLLADPAPVSEQSDFQLEALPSVVRTQKDISAYKARFEMLVQALGQSGDPDLFPKDIKLVEAEPTSNGTWRIVLSGSFKLLSQEAQEDAEERLTQFMGALNAFQLNTPVEVWLEGGEAEDFAEMIHQINAKSPFKSHDNKRVRLRGVTIEDVAPDAPLLQKNGVPPIKSEDQAKLSPPNRARTNGALSGKRIAVSPGHGWVNRNGWRTQRSAYTFSSNARGITEDFFNAEVMNNQIIPLLQGAGADVIATREPDMNTKVPQQVLDDSSNSSVAIEGEWNRGTSGGGYSGSYLSSNSSEASVTFTPNFTAPTTQRLSIRWREGSNRSTDTRVEVHHAGGTSNFFVNQQKSGQVWLDLGQFVFDQNSEVIVHGSDNGYAIADAVKFGSGIYTNGSTQYPWWQMSGGRYVPTSADPASRFATCPSVGDNTSTSYCYDVYIRANFANDLNADAYFSFHGNAAGTANSTAHGLQTYRYSCGTYSDYSSSDAARNCDDPVGSKAYADAIHNSIVEIVHRDYDPNFKNNGRFVADLGEVRVPDNMPAALVEAGFFDNLTAASGQTRSDNEMMQDPRWREAVAMGIVTGMARYFNGSSTPPMPVRPEGLSVRNLPEGGITLSWTPVSGATYYRVYRATQGRAFDDGTRSTGNSITLNNLEPRQTYVFRVAAVNSTGEGFASQAVTVRYRGAKLDKPSQALYIGAYDRRDAFVQDIDNDLSYAVEHGHALASVEDLFFDGALDELVESGQIDLNNYQLVDLAVGKDSTEHDAISTKMQTVLANYIANGGKVIVSGEEIGWDLGNRGNAADANFLANSLGAIYAADDGGSKQLSASANGPFAGISNILLDDGTNDVYEVKYPDAFSATTGGTVVLNYANGSGAAIATDHSILIGAGIEAIVPDAKRAQVMAAAVKYLIGDQATGDLDGDGMPDSWEIQYGLNIYDSSDANDDPDNDGATNLEEYLAGTDPLRNENSSDEDAAVLPDAAIPDAAIPDADIEDAYVPPQVFDAYIPIEIDAYVRPEPIDAHVPPQPVEDAGNNNHGPWYSDADFDDNPPTASGCSSTPSTPNTAWWMLLCMPVLPLIRRFSRLHK